MCSPDSLEELFVDLPYQPKRYRKLTQSTKPILMGIHIVGHFANIRNLFLPELGRFKEQEIRKRRAGSLYSAGQHGFATHERTYQKVWIRQCSRDTGEFT